MPDRIRRHAVRQLAICPEWTIPCGMASDTKKRFSRRQFVIGTASGFAGSLAAGCVIERPGHTRKRSMDIRVTDVSYRFDEYLYRAPVKFAGAIMDRATVITV